MLSAHWSRTPAELLDKLGVFTHGVGASGTRLLSDGTAPVIVLSLSFCLSFPIVTYCFSACWIGGGRHLVLARERRVRRWSWMDFGEMHKFFSHRFDGFSQYFDDMSKKWSPRLWQGLLLSRPSPARTKSNDLRLCMSHIDHVTSDPRATRCSSCTRPHTSPTLRPFPLVPHKGAHCCT